MRRKPIIFIFFKKHPFLVPFPWLLTHLFIIAHRAFFSYTETEEEVSLILNQATSAIFPPESINVHTEGWRLLKIDVGDKPLGFDEAGIVSSIADPLASAKITLFYISTFSTDYPLVPASDVSRAVQVLASSKFDIVSS